MRSVIRRGFTLIELLTVMAISALLLTVIVVPVYDSFNITRQAQAFAEAQDRARIVADKISRAVGNAVSVRNTNVLIATTLNSFPTQVAANSLIIQVPAMGSTTSGTAGYIEVVLPYVKLDLIPPAEGDAASIGGLGYTNPNNGFIDPTLLSPKGQPTLPAGPGATLVRYFVGLRDPFNVYNNPYDGILMAANGARDNLFVLYRAEVTPLVFRPGQGNNGDTSTKLRPNLAFFQSDMATDTQIIDEDDPRFFLSDGAINAGIGNTKAQRVQGWLTTAQSESSLSRYDMIQPIYNKFSHAVTYSGNAPQIIPLIQFRPAHIDNDPARGQVAIRPGEETTNAAALGPQVFKTQFCLWSNQVARVWPQGWNPTIGAQAQYFVGRNDPSNGTPGAPPGYSIYYYDPAISTTDYNSGVECFDIFTYEYVSATQGLYPFSQAITASNNRSNWLSNPTILARFTPFDMNSAKGYVRSDFDISEVGNPNIAILPTNPDPQNLPTDLTSPAGYGPWTPATDPSLGGNFYDPAYATINEKFNKVWSDNPNLQPNLDRFIDLRLATSAPGGGDGSVSPMHPTLGFPKAHIVPGSEVVYGPDQLIGPNFGNTVRYVRSTRSPGPNQYQINYDDQPEPVNPGTRLIDYTMIGLTPAQVAGFNPTVYDPTNFCSAVIQPRYKRGYIRLNSDPNAALPLGQIQVDYRFQFNGSTVTYNGSQTGAGNGGVVSSDAFAVDYDTRQLINVLLTIRNYPQTTNVPNPQTVTVKATATLRNVIR